MKEKVVLAYSGGLDTSVILKWLLLQGKEVVAYIADVGQEEDFDLVRSKAIAIGTHKVYVEDLRHDFVTQYIFPALKGSALYEGRYLLGTALARPLIALRQTEIAALEKCSAVAHGATGKGNDQVRFELSYTALNPELKVFAPWKDKEFLREFQGRTDLLSFAKRHGIPVEATNEKPYSTDSNLMHTSYEAGVLEDPSKAPPSDMFKRTVDPHEAPNQANTITIEFKKGVPRKVTNHNGGFTVEDPLGILSYLNVVGGKNGIGRIDIVENRYVGIKSRGVYETPGCTILWKAHQDLEAITIDREVNRLQELLRTRFSEVIYYGYWFSPEMDFLKAAFEHSQRTVTGCVTLELYKGNVSIRGRSADTSLYSAELASMDKAGGYDQADASGFIKVNAVRLRTYQQSRRAGEE